MNFKYKIVNLMIPNNNDEAFQFVICMSTCTFVRKGWINRLYKQVWSFSCFHPSHNILFFKIQLNLKENDKKVPIKFWMMK